MKVMNKILSIKLAIDHYNVLTKSQKSILKSLVDMAVNNEVVITIEELSKINKATRATVTTALEIFKKNGIIMVSNQTGVRFSSCFINQEKIDEIMKHYTNKRKFL